MEDSAGIRRVSFKESLGVYRYGLRVTCKLGIGLGIGLGGFVGYDHGLFDYVGRGHIKQGCEFHAGRSIIVHCVGQDHFHQHLLDIPSSGFALKP